MLAHRAGVQASTIERNGCHAGSYCYASGRG